jgi:manganese/zinc/iron transport system ATP- binding protein
VVAVHHDLESVREYFDYVVLLNMRIIAAGPTETVFTRENLQKTYGGKLTVLSDIADAIMSDEPSKALFSKARKAG